MLDVGTLRLLFRGLRGWQAAWESDGVDVVTDHDGSEWHIADVEYLLDVAQGLPPRQYQSIRYFLVENMLERDVAVMMGTSPTNPAASYATDGLVNLIKWINEGRLDRFRGMAA